MALLMVALLCSFTAAQSSNGADRKMITNSMGMIFVEIKSGTFMMGSPANEPGRYDQEKQHKVTLTKGFFISKMLVTLSQFRKFVADTGYQTDAEKDGWAYARSADMAAIRVNGASWRNPGFAQAEDHPVVEISWNDAVAFCLWLSQKESKHYRLPTEAEWEYCCRAGTQTIYPWGNNPDDGKGWANVGDRTEKDEMGRTGFNWSDGYVFTSPVGKFKPNAWGLYDMIGNVWEWCSDCYGDYPDSDVIDPQGPDEGVAPKESKSTHRDYDYFGPFRIARGGSWYSGPRESRSAYRSHSLPVDRDGESGFRVLLDL
jgi:formylglycine-generating enzyme required for sulfatase activity